MDRDRQSLPVAKSTDRPIELSDQERLARLRLIRSKNVGPKTFQDLIEHFGSADAALDGLPSLSERGGRRSYTVYSSQKAESELRDIDRIGAKIVGLNEAGYPNWLREIDAPPPLLCIQGRAEIADQPMAAIVGARNGSAVGRKFARQLARDLGDAGYVIVSGLARGIDTAAHEAALEKGTAGVLAGGLGNVYPPENEKLQRTIGEIGLLVSERPPAFKPKGQDFPRRNRLISGMALATIVVEAAKRSGSLITARLAGEQGRDVFAVPGHPLDPRAGGTNRLLQEGAGLVTCAEDVIAALEPMAGLHKSALMPIEPEPTDTAGPSPEAAVEADARALVVQALGAAPVDIDEVIRATALNARDVQVVLLEMDLAGRLERHGQQLVSLKDPS